MSFKLPADYKKRIPLVLRYKSNNIFFQQQFNIVGEDGQGCKIACQHYKIENVTSLREIGELTISILNKFQKMGDLTLAELDELMNDPDEKTYFYEGSEYLNFMNIKESDDIKRTHIECSIHYTLNNQKYEFGLSWTEKCGNHCYYNSSDSLGKTGVLTFDSPLEFTEYPDPEVLGKMIMEAFERSRKMGDIMSGDYCPPRTIELLNESEVIVEAPRDKHFAEYGDYGVGDLHQAYLYFAKEGAESSAEIYLGIAAELDCDMSEDNIRRAWEKQNGKAEFFEVKAAEHGIFKLRAEMRNKSVHRISYLLQIDESELLDCTMELRKPNSRKKLDEKLTGLFEEFARQCKFKN